MKSTECISFNRSIPVKYETDVFIAGGGPAGIAAAVTAARAGCRVFLAEGQSCFGGMGTSGLIPVFMQFGDGINILSAGIGNEILNHLDISEQDDVHNIVTIKSELLKRVYDELLISAGVVFSLMTNLIAVEMDDNTSGLVSSVVLFGKSGIFAVKAKIYIDCTGDGDLAAWAGASYQKGDEAGNMMAGTLCSSWTGINWNNVKWEDQEANIEQAFVDGTLSVEDRHLPGIFRSAPTEGTGNVGHCFGVDGTDEVSLTNALVSQRRSLSEYENYYRKYCRGFENTRLLHTAALPGIRETRRIFGDYVLSLKDFNERAVFYDEIGRYCYAVDIHESSPKLDDYQKFLGDYTNLRYHKGESYGIPYRILTPAGLRNVLTAGRCVSTDRYMQSSIRVMPGCFITGQAAGVAAAIAVNEKTDTRGFDISLVQKAIRDLGGYIPNFR